MLQLDQVTTVPQRWSIAWDPYIKRIADSLYVPQTIDFLFIFLS